MKPIKTSKTNRTFVLAGGTEENNLPLELTFDAGEPDAPILVSTWELTDPEREWIANGGVVLLTVWGMVHPPVAMHVGEPEGNVLGTQA